jgi:hypothetical protein
MLMERQYPRDKFCCGGFFSALFGGSTPSAPKPPTQTAGTANQAALAKQRQGRGLASTNLSGMRQMVDAYQSGKASLGA